MLSFLLPSPPPGFESPQVLSLQATPWESKIEPGGRAYETFVRILQGKTTLSHTEFVDPAEADDDAGDSAKYAHHKKTTKIDKLIGVTETDYYELLELGEKRWLSTQEEIKKAYRKACLVHHPDKQANAGEGEVNEELFKNIQKAYETLSNPKLKRGYDSKDSFDDSVPSASEIKSDEDFYVLFGKCFERNTKWATNPRLPKLGDANTSLAEAQKFYSSWYQFKSWREFNFSDEYDPENAESREEKRWMERKNAKDRTRKEREEQVRVMSMIDLAYKLDPRIRKQLEEEKFQKEEFKRKRQEAIQKKKDDEERVKQEAIAKEEEEKRKLESERKAASEDRSKLANIKKKRRQRIRQYARKFAVVERDVDYICENQDVDAMLALCGRMDALPNPTKASVEAFFAQEVANWKNKSDDKSPKTEAPAQVKVVVEVEKPGVWTNEELALLQKAVVKFPTGIRERWLRISEFIGGKKTEKQIIARVKSGLISPTSTDDQFTKWQKERTQTKRETDTSGGTENYEAPTPAAPVSPKAAEPVKAAEPETKAEPEKTESVKEESKEDPAKTEPVKEEATTTEATEEKEVEWTLDEQKLLEDALKKFPAKLGKERWAKIAEAVPGKTRRDCVERYKILVAAIQQTKK